LQDGSRTGFGHHAVQIHRPWEPPGAVASPAQPLKIEQQKAIDQQPASPINKQMWV
jgi:hypothetical protein